MAAIHAATTIGAFSSEKSFFIFERTISTNTEMAFNYRQEALNAGWDGIKPLKATLTVGEGVYMTSDNTMDALNSSALKGQVATISTGYSFPEGSELFLINRGYITGRGGMPAANAASWYSSGSGSGHLANHGWVGILASYPLTISNYGTVAGGGGGGSLQQINPRTVGGGGAGLGASGPTTSPATWTAGAVTGTGTGNGGSAGSSAPGTFGGDGGSYISGDGAVTWLVGGTRLGSAWRPFGGVPIYPTTWAYNGVEYVGYKSTYAGMGGDAGTIAFRKFGVLRDQRIDLFAVYGTIGNYRLRVVWEQGTVSNPVKCVVICGTEVANPAYTSVSAHQQGPTTRYSHTLDIPVTNDFYSAFMVPAGALDIHSGE